MQRPNATATDPALSARIGGSPILFGIGSPVLEQSLFLSSVRKIETPLGSMADAGIVGAHKGSQARGVTMTVEEWDALQKQVAADMDSGYAADEVAGSTGDDD